MNASVHKRVRKISGDLEPITQEIRYEQEISDWNQTALKIYTCPATLWNICRGLLFAQVLPLLEGHARARMLILKDRISTDSLKKIKHQIRKKLPPENYIIHHQDEVFATSPGFMHSPDFGNSCYEYNVSLEG